MNDNEDFYTVGEMDTGGYVHILKLGPHQCIIMYRNIYRAYNETPMTKGPFMNPKTAKKLLKIGLAVTSMFLYGAMHKTEKMLNEKIDDHYAEPKDESEEEQNED